jgi:hypothetical protein
VPNAVSPAGGGPIPHIALSSKPIDDERCRVFRGTVVVW